MESFRFEASPEVVFADKETRTIRGLAMPVDIPVPNGGRTWRFAKDSIVFNERTPALKYHDTTRPVGKLVSSEWTDRGLEVVLKVSNTFEGTEALELAADGVFGFSVGIDVPDGGARFSAKEVRVSRAIGKEISLTPVPAFAGSIIDEVKFEKEEAAMPEENTAADVAALNANIEKMTVAFEAFASRPEVQPVPRVEVNEEPLYRFEGEPGQYDFATDVKAMLNGQSAARERLDNFVAERFAVTVGNVAGLTPNGYDPSLYVGPRPYNRILTRVITQHPLSNVGPFAYPVLTSVTGPWVSEHTPGVEPALAGGATWGMTTITPGELSGKVEILKEVKDLADAQVSAFLWNRFVMEYEKAAEARLVAMLDGLTLPGDQVVPLAGTGTALADDLDDLVIDLAEPERFAGLAAAPGLFKDLYKARDADGRKLFPAVGQAVNADGTANGRVSLDLNGVVAFKSKDTTNSYLIDPGTVHQFLSAPERLEFTIQIKSSYLGLFGYHAEHVTDTSGVIRITHA